MTDNTAPERIERDMNGESFMGLRVAAYMEDCETPMGIVPRFSSHWSTPGRGAKNVQRLFTQSQVAPLAARVAEQGDEIERLEAERDAARAEGARLRSLVADLCGKRDSIQKGLLDTEEGHALLEMVWPLAELDAAMQEKGETHD